jgi:tellurite resistance protein TerC
VGTSLLWLAFNLFALLAIALDLGLFHRRPHKMQTREALAWTLVWLSLTVVFGLSLFHFAGAQRGLEFFTGYVIEQALSFDNLFLFLVIFRAFAVDDAVQHRVLEWGILGALLARGLMIAAGAGLIRRFSWILYLLGAFLILAGLHMLFAHRKELHPERNALSRFLSTHLRVTKTFHGAQFFVRQPATPISSSALSLSPAEDPSRSPWRSVGIPAGSGADGFAQLGPASSLSDAPFQAPHNPSLTHAPSATVESPSPASRLASSTGKLFATPLFVVLLIVEFTDITLAVDSIPAIFGVTRDPFIVYTSNVFAILGLRSMYFLLAGALGRLRFLYAGLSFVLMFIGAKMLLEPWLHVSIQLSLGVVAGILLLALAASL